MQWRCDMNIGVLYWALGLEKEINKFAYQTHVSVWLRLGPCMAWALLGRLNRSLSEPDKSNSLCECTRLSWEDLLMAFCVGYIHSAHIKYSAVQTHGHLSREQMYSAIEKFSLSLLSLLVSPSRSSVVRRVHAGQKLPNMLGIVTISGALIFPLGCTDQII